jgi:CDP-glycerol:poly(glycerophosphate) glycerophosphotransferase
VALALFAVAVAVVAGRGAATLSRAAPTGVAPTGTAILIRVLAALSLSAIYEPGEWVSTLVLVGVLLAERSAATLARVAVPYVANLPGVTVRNRWVVEPRWLFAVNTAGLLGYGALCVGGVSDGPFFVLGLALLAATGAVLVDGTLRVLSRYRAERRLRPALEAYAPRFLVYWQAPAGSDQLAMWLPYLERLGQRFVIVLRNPATFAEVAALTSRPLVVVRYGSELDGVVVGSMRTVFYVNTSPKNDDLLRFLDLCHIQLNHGDSDKATSYRRLFRVYDKNFVAGQAAIDRFANHGVLVPREAFEIVGRPQVEDIATVDGPPAEGRQVVLYAPTWFGFLSDSHYSSLPWGVRIVETLLQRGRTVVFRPHPWTSRSAELRAYAAQICTLLRLDQERTGRAHVFGSVAESELSLVDCFNAADALVTDVSSVVSDFLFSAKPFAVTATQPSAGPEEFAKDCPLAAAGYVLPVASLDADLDGVLDLLLGDDPKAALRRGLRTAYLGPFCTEGYADHFVEVARRYV